MSDGDHGHGARLYYGTNATAVSSGTAIGNIMSITGPNQTRDTIDTSTMDSTTKWRDFIPGMLDAGELTFECNYNGAAAGDAEVLDTQFTATAYTWYVAFNDGSNTVFTNNSLWYASGVMTALGHGIPFDDKMTQSITIKLTGVPVFKDIGAF